MQNRKTKHITPQSKDFPQWYQDVVKVAELSETSDVRGCGIVKPYGYKIWNLIKQELSTRIEHMGVEDVYFPVFLPLSNLEAEAEHVKGFSPELAVVTHAGGDELKDKLAVRPTSEAAMYGTYAKWIQSYRDLPFKLNQWANVVRWEKRPRAFLRWSEFQWQEGHTAFADENSAIDEVWSVLDMYEDLYKWMSIPVLSGKKSELEKFAGAVMTTTVEAIAKDGKAIQAGTSHYLGTNFAKVFNIQFLGKDGNKHYVHQNSWGLSWRSVGAVIMVHGDDNGLRLPPNVAPWQVVIIPIFNNDNRSEIVSFARNIEKDLSHLRIKFDDRESKTPGFKFNEWEVKGVPLRLEIGERDIKDGSVMVFRRDTCEKHKIKLSDLKHSIDEILQDISQNLFQQADNFIKSNMKQIEHIDKINDNTTFFEASWSETPESERILKDKFGIVSRVLLKNKMNVSPRNKKCFITGEPAKHDWIFAKSY